MSHRILRGFYVLEGIDGSGTTTQLKNMEKMAAIHNMPLYTTFEPTDSPLGRAIRQTLRGEYPLTQESLARLFSADRCDHVDNPDHGILAQLDRGIKVLSDRYLFSSLVYQSIDFSFDTVYSLNQFPLPEVLFYIDTPPDVGIARRAERTLEEIYEKDALQTQIYDRYRDVISHFADSGMHTVIVDGTLPPEDISKTLWSYIA